MFAARSFATQQRFQREDSALEDRLFSALSPVQANPEFVDSLKVRLTSSPGITVERRTDLAAAAVIGFGLFAGVFAVWMLLMARYFFRRRKGGNASTD